MRPARRGIWLSCQNFYQRLETKGFRNFLLQHASRVHGSIPCRFFLLSFYIVILWYMSLFKAWSEDKLNKKFVLGENFAELVSKGKWFCLFSKISDSVFPQWRVGDLTLFEAVVGGAFDLLNWQHSNELDQNFSQKSNAQGFARGGGKGWFWNWPVHKCNRKI